MMAQAISTKGSEPPLIATGHENMKDNTLLALQWKKDLPGKVTHVDMFKGDIEVESNGKTHKFKLPTAIESQKYMTISFIPPKVGDTLTKGDFVYRSNNFSKDGQIQIGQNLRTAFMYWRGFEFEDSFAISESCAKALTHHGEYTLEYDVKVGERIVDILKPGQRCSSTDREYVISVEKDVKINKAQEGLNNLVRVSKTITKTVGPLLPNNLVNAILVDVKYKEVVEDKDNKKILDETSRLNYRTSMFSKAPEFEEEFGEISTVGLRPPSHIKTKSKNKVSYRIYMKFVTAHPVKNGDKLTNRFGSKGVVSAVVPDKEMPRTMSGEVIDIIINPSSVIARKNLPQTEEAILSKMTEILWKKIDRMSSKASESKTKAYALLNRYHMDWLTEMSWADFREYHESLRDSKTKYQVRTGSYSKFTPQRVAEIQKTLGVDDKEYLLDGKSGMRIKTPIMTGWTYIMKLHHLADFKNKITADPKDRNQLVLGLGNTRQEGQKIGEMESIALISHGVTKFLKDVRGGSNSDWFLANMVMSNMVVVDSRGNALLIEKSLKPKRKSKLVRAKTRNII